MIGQQFISRNAAESRETPSPQQTGIGLEFYMKSTIIWMTVFLAIESIANAPANAKDPSDTNPNLNLIPWPKSVQFGSGQILLTQESQCVIADEKLRPLAQVLIDELAKLTNLKLKIKTEASRAGDIVLKINPSIKADDPLLTIRKGEPVRSTDGAHTIAIGEQAVVEGFDYRATAEGTSTLVQLLRKSQVGYSLPKITIKDWPHADYCGVMLDVARQDHPIESIKKVVQICRFYKARYLQLHLTDDQGWTFPSSKYPQLGSKNHGAHGGVAPRVYKLDELKDLVDYADARGVTLVPELEMPGHSGAALRSLPEIFDAINPESKQAVGMGCMNMSNEEIYPALDTIIGEMCAIFRSSPYFHIGSDEVTSGRLSLHPGYKAFMAKHGLKDDDQLANHFIASACAIVKKHGKKAIKWEGLANNATKDVIVMAWEGNSNVASEMVARGRTIITCPWNLGVPWEEWNMYVCNASRLKRGDSVLGATLVAWEQPPHTHITNLRSLAHRQERTWGPDNSVTVEGFASRFQSLDAVVGRLIELPPLPRVEAQFTSTAGVDGFLDPVLAIDGRDETFFRTARALKTGDHFTMQLPKVREVHSIEVLTGINRRGLLNDGEVQVSADGNTFATVGTLKNGIARSILKDNRVQTIRIRATSEQKDAMVLRAINLSFMVELFGKISNPASKIGDDNVGVIAKDTEFAYPIGTFAHTIVNRGFTLTLNNGGNPCTISGSITGRGRVRIQAPGANAPLTIEGRAANTLEGVWMIAAGRVVLSKEANVDAMGGTIEVEPDSILIWIASNQIHDSAEIRLSGTLNLNGHVEKLAKLAMTPRGRVQTGGQLKGGVLTLSEASINGKPIPHGVYSSNSWVRGRGYVVVGNVKQVEVGGDVDDANRSIGADNIAKLKSPATVRLSEGGISFAIDLNEQPLRLSGVGKSRFEGLITGIGKLSIESSMDQPLEFGGAASNTYHGATTLNGVVRLSKSNGAVAIPGDLQIGAVDSRHKESGIVLGADGQLAAAATVSLVGTQVTFVALDGHKAQFAKLILSKTAVIRAGDGGGLRIKQLHIDGKRLKDGEYRAPQPWLQGTGTVVVDSRVDVQGVIGSPETAIGGGNIGNLIGPAKISYPSSGGDFDILTNGHTLTLDSGDGNAFAFLGAISGTGNVEFFMGPSYTGYRDAPMILTGSKPNTTTGEFRVKKGRVQLEKPDGVDAISGDVVIGGQGFNDCLFWKNSNQLKDTVNITLIDAGNSGAAYLHLNGCVEKAASLTMTGKNKVFTDSAKGDRGTLTVKALTIAGKPKPAGTYTSATEPWIEGGGRIIVLP